MNLNNFCCAESTCCPANTSRGVVAVVPTTLSLKDFLGGCKVRWGIGRMHYVVKPGLYGVGKPDENSPVLVSANYKLTFDTLRKNLSGLDCWLLILDTKGVNVWCAAGKGTFGTEELIHRIKETGVSAIVAHRRLILPQLGASGVNSNEVSRRSGFSVVFGPVRARDIRRFIADGCAATRAMRTVEFTAFDRLVLTPVELVAAAKTSLPVFGVLFLINLFAARQFGAFDLAAYLGAVVIGTVLTPLLLPVIPGKAFAWKGWILGLIWSIAALWLFGWFSSGFWRLAVGYLLLLPSVSAYLAMNFTGSSTYTSPSGVLREMKIALPLIMGAAVIGTALVLAQSILG
ncbi:MAG: mercury methylation corrinoid protein HgcA [Proteobacteria bacterium]|nr:mercury methylation corrinoid protein HgcA [Pseudomonadota bacterium]